MESFNQDSEEYRLYKLYWSLCLSDILTKLKLPINKEYKSLLHDYNKKVLGYRTISNESKEVISKFISEVCLYWGERGIFVRTSRRQPKNIEWMPLSTIWDLLSLIIIFLI